MGHTITLSPDHPSTCLGCKLMGIVISIFNYITIIHILRYITVLCIEVSDYGISFLLCYKRRKIRSNLKGNWTDLSGRKCEFCNFDCYTMYCWYHLYTTQRKTYSQVMDLSEMKLTIKNIYIYQARVHKASVPILSLIYFLINLIQKWSYSITHNILINVTQRKLHEHFEISAFPLISP